MSRHIGPQMNSLATLRTPNALADAGLVRTADIAALDAVAARYAVAITPAVAELIEPGDGPLRRQFIPSVAELTQTRDETADPIGDDAHSPVEGIVHRYPDRVLLKPTHTCAVYCRFCFRRETVGQATSKSLSKAGLDRAMAYIAGRPEIWEIIVTGGDPLILSPRRLADIARRLDDIAHVKILRFHTRVPVVEPERVTESLVGALTASSKTVWLAIHANCAEELTPQAARAIGRLADAGVPLLGQTVLLRGVNDQPAALERLMRRFVELRIKPYYLHHGDLAPGTSHFRTTLAEGQALAANLRGRVSGLCQPTYVLDIPGGHGKAPIAASHLLLEGDSATVTDVNGHRHAYPPAPDKRSSGVRRRP